MASKSSLIKNEIQFSSYIRKFRRERVQSHICVTASRYMAKYIFAHFLIYDFAPDPVRIFLYCILRKLCSLFYQCCVTVFFLLVYGTLPHPATRPSKTYSVAVRAIPLSVCHQGPPNVTGPDSKGVQTRSNLFN